ncbi:MAG: 5'/3'-nucleotidase SurE [Coraliomargaritaceae bacterium]
MATYRALVTNDDGIDSFFLQHLVEALLPRFTVSVAAPKTEQSWIGRAISRHSDIHVEENMDIFPKGVEAWSLTGTPSDCVNIALGHLLSSPPDIVLSGINLGYNTTEILILSSGTIAGAIEGTLWGIPSIAFSQAIPNALYSEISENKGQTDEGFNSVIQASAKKAAQLALETIQQPPNKGTVLNVNFPDTMNAETGIERTQPAKIHLGSLYKEVKKDCFRFQYSEGKRLCANSQSDRDVLSRGNVSVSELNFSQIGRPQ